MSSSARSQWLEQMRRQMAALGGAVSRETELLSAGQGGLLDRLLARESPRQGLLMDWLARDGGSGAWLLALLTIRDRRPLVIIDEQREFCPSQAAALGLDLSGVIVVLPDSRHDLLWAWEQALRSPQMTVVGQLESLPTPAQRRLKLAAEQGGGWGVMLRSARQRSTAAWADLRLLVTAVPTPPEGRRSLTRRMRVEVLYARGRLDQQQLLVEVDDETASVSLVSELANPTSQGRPSRAS
ncbi:MAG: ImuA family protein [Planctomycetaceae bacterium]